MLLAPCLNAVRFAICVCVHFAVALIFVVLCSMSSDGGRATVKILRLLVVFEAPRSPLAEKSFKREA
ncbi:hypothetical protein L596_025354 [Steinernema carpocapsae]|uniref:Uncharacterized protein n=1 Tax=Steinernema carpocapsae TaxID=34508 RepID=A0A4U5M7I3_STECR|nr:hypothetical protein L596_025354 [Steinernema carpocapsae]